VVRRIRQRSVKWLPLQTQLTLRDGLLQDRNTGKTLISKEKTRRISAGSHHLEQPFGRSQLA
jgi:hypothetical protein